MEGGRGGGIEEEGERRRLAWAFEISKPTLVTHLFHEDHTYSNMMHN